MLKNNIIKENLQLLDSALSYLIESETLSLHIDDLKIKLIKETEEKLEINNLNNSSIEELFDDIFKKGNQKTKNLIMISEVLLLLESKKLIRLIEQNHIRITYKGVIQQSKGYVSSYNLKAINSQRLQNMDQIQTFHLIWMVILTFLIALGTLIAAV